MQLLLVLGSVVSVLASAACGTGIYKSPKVSPFATVELQLGPYIQTNTTEGSVSMFPVLAGNITGQYRGRLAPGLSAVTERALHAPKVDGFYTEVDSRWVFEADKAGKDRVFATIDGQTTYGVNSLHGMGRAVLRTDSEKYAWVNWASFIVEWQANFNTGGAEFQFSNISTGGRVDGKPIPVLEPPSGK